MRWLLGAGGVVVGVYGAWLLLTRQSGDQLVSAGQWLVGGVLLHDAVLAPVVVVAGVLTARALPTPVRAPASVVAVVLGSVTLLAVPVLGGFGRRPDNPSLLDRDYTAGWLLVAGLVVGGVVAGTTVRAMLRRRRGDGLRAGR